MLEEEKIKCKYCGADVRPEAEKYCIQNKEYWKDWFQKFHKELDKAVGVFILENSKGIHTKLPSETSLMEFMSWSYTKTK